jgi:hypothetical protein
LARFRAWRERTLPAASYQLEPAFWTPARRRSLSRYDAATLGALKRREPQVTGLAYTNGAVYLVIAAAKATYAHVAKLMHCRDLIRRDPDYAAHRDKRIVLVLLCDECPRKDAEFARRIQIDILAVNTARATATMRLLVRRRMPVEPRQVLLSV